ncbi:glycopeptide antibiotics resistance protein [Paenibacillus turicensis]|uniref:Glycopeptide antibiotics resistance protein n=1 Tax=Paenibacillus turicensis TaxID=160487 RepID=A0ABS4FYR0_9BACL|nr:VanZ family protein [Paenibacillus turicensis]MBP1907674.1 glycopeptide antibiotics resistance protein [Paenibacillus turicensis]
MISYTQPIFVAAIAFVVIAFIIFIPWLIYTYRKFGYFPLSTTLISFSFIFYFLAALFLVLLPLPETRDTCSIQKPGTQFYSLVPFQFVTDTLKDSGIVLSQPATYRFLFSQPSFYQAFFNFLLLLPFGVYLRYFFQERKYWKRALGLTFLLTLFYEITQVTGIYGIYNCPYRIFDVDDLMLNTAGGILGFFIAPAILALFPSKEKMNEKAEKLLALDEVRSMSVLLAFAIDIFISNVIITIVLNLLQVNIVNTLMVNTVVLFVSLFIVPWRWNGATLGTKFMRFRYDSKVSRFETTKRLLKRFGAIYAVYLIIVFLKVLNYVNIPMDSPFYKVSIFFNLGAGLTAICVTLVLFIHVMIVTFSKQKRRYYFDEVSDLYTTRKNESEVVK